MKNTFKKISLALALITASYTTQAQQQTEEKYALKVSFISYGAGTDKKAGETFQKFIDSQSVKPTFEKNGWGREGEYDCCFKLSGLKKRKQKKFIAKLKTEMKPYELVRITENTTCSKPRGK